MKKTYKFLTLTGLSAVMCLFLAMPAMAQRGGGGGHSGGGGSSSGGGRSGGGFSGGGGGRSSVGVSGRSGSVAAPQRGSNLSSARGFSGGRSLAGGRSFAGGRNLATGATAHRGFVRGSVGGGVYGHGGSYGRYGWGRHGGYFYNGGFYGSLYYPWLGLGFGFLPYGYYPFYWGGNPYFYSDGFYYQYNNDQYTVVEPPVGAAINTMPTDAQSIVINGQQYYEKNGVYYQAVTKADGTVVYQVAGKDGQLNTGATGADAVAPKVGDVVNQLPPDCRKVKLAGAVYYVSEDGIYYQEFKDNNNNTAYKIVGLDGAGTDNLKSN
jgi:hypothetical protein